MICSDYCKKSYKLLKLESPVFTKPDFVKPSMDSVKIQNKEKGAKELDFDINQPLEKNTYSGNEANSRSYNIP